MHNSTIVISTNIVRIKSLQNNTFEKSYLQ